MMQLPRTWVYNLKDPVSLMTRWDKAVTAIVNVIGYKTDEIGRESYYVQPDTQLRNTVFSPGHPQVNMGGVEPGEDKYNGYREDVYQLQGPAHAPDWVFHEFGHAVLLTNPGGEHESSNNFLHATALNWGLGIPLDKAFGNSRGSHNPNRTLDNTAILWMTANNFHGGVMEPGQKSYQLQGHAKYVDLARLFGWQTIGDFYRTVNRERMAYRHSDGKEGREWPKNVSSDEYVLQLSESSGIDMRPLFHFWGTPPQAMVTLAKNPQELREAVDDAKADMQKAEAAQKAGAGSGDKQAAAEAGKALAQAKSQLAEAEKQLAAHPQELAEAKAYAKHFDELIESGKIKRSARIYDELVKYKNIVPPDQAAYRKFALAWYDNWHGKPREGKMFWTERGHAALWDTYSPKVADGIRADVQHLIGMYFPKDRPAR